MLSNALKTVFYFPKKSLSTAETKPKLDTERMSNKVKANLAIKILFSRKFFKIYKIIINFEKILNF